MNKGDLPREKNLMNTDMNLVYCSRTEVIMKNHPAVCLAELVLNISYEGK